MRKKELRIINFLNLSHEKYMKILEYRNQEFVRVVSNSTELITSKQHNDYHKLLEKKDIFFAFLITCEDKDYAVINFKKLEDGSFYVGYYLVDELYKFEGGGVVLHNCMMFICWKLGIKFISYDIKIENSRVFRVGYGGKTISSSQNGDSYHYITELFEFDNDIVKNTKSRKLFDKLYDIKEMQI